MNGPIRPTDSFDRLNHFLGKVLDVRFMKSAYREKEALGLFPPAQWQGSALSPRPRRLIAQPESLLGQGNPGLNNIAYRQRGG